MFVERELSQLHICYLFLSSPVLERNISPGFFSQGEVKSF